VDIRLIDLHRVEGQTLCCLADQSINQTSMEVNVDVQRGAKTMNAPLRCPTPPARAGCGGPLNHGTIYFIGYMTKKRGCMTYEVGYHFYHA